jgi:hypothetical protein
MSQYPSVQPLYFFKGQVVHFLSLVCLLGLVWLWVDYDRLSERQLFGWNAQVWFVISLAVPILHQVFVWLAWRSELCFGKVTNRLGSRAFVIYETVFFILFFARPVSLMLLAIADHDSFELRIPARIGICVVLGLPAVYTAYSVARYFGMGRASGADHFDASYGKLPLVNGGIFRFTNNAMYTYAFLFFWIIAIAGASSAALVVAFFSHAYIWVHYFCTERPDMEVIYGP